jgi:AcrR family transcriptional regulator
MIDTRKALLDAGVRLYGRSANEQLKGLSAGAVAEAAGYHRQTFYRYWGTQREYVSDLIRHLLDTRDPPPADGVTTLSEEVDDLDGFARGLAHRDLFRLLDDPRTMMRIGLLVTQALEQAPIPDLLQDFYDRAIGQLTTGYEDLLDRTDRVPVDGTTARDLARILHALLLGLVLQVKAAEDDPHVGVLLERAGVVLLEGLTEPVAAPRSATA